VDRHSTADLPSPAHLTFQVILYPNGRILMQYLTMSGFLTSATIGIQNGSKDVGLNVVYNDTYVHDAQAIEFRPIPDWVRLDPTSGTIPAGGHQDVMVTLDATGLEDGVHEGRIDLASNDPYRPLVQVPVTLNVGLTPITYLDFDPDVLNLNAMGQMVRVVIELPEDWDPHAIDVGSIRLNDVVPALPAPVAYTDENANGIEEIVVRFDRAAVEAVLPEGDSVLIAIQGEIPGETWFRGTTTVRAIRPRVTHPNGGEYVSQGQPVTLRWNPASGTGGVRYEVWLSRDGGAAWESLATGLNVTSFDWIVSGALTDGARIRVFAVDGRGVMGYDTSDADFIIAGPLQPPHAIGATLEVGVDPADVLLSWKRPTVDTTHGPADRYRVLRSFSPQGPWSEIAGVTTESARAPLSGTTGAFFVYYKVVAGNAAGYAEE
jgi:hypothetical protein